MDDGVVIKDEAHLTDDEWVGLEDLNLPKTTTREQDHASMSFTVCYDDDCWIHASEKRDRDYYPRMHHRIPPPTSPLSSASEMSWNPDEHEDPHTLQGRSEKKEGGKKLRKTVRWADETPTPTPPPSPSSTVTEVDTIEALQRQATRMHDRQNQLEVDVRLYQGQQKMLNDTILSLRREKTELKTRITSLKATEGLARRWAEDWRGKFEREKRRNGILRQRNRDLGTGLRRRAQELMDLAGWEEDEDVIMA